MTKFPLIASQIKLRYLIAAPDALGYESAIRELKALGYTGSAADDFLFEKDADWRVAQIKNGDIKEGPALLTAVLNGRA
jgi:hypothetical protein